MRPFSARAGVLNIQISVFSYISPSSVKVPGGGMVNPQKTFVRHFGFGHGDEKNLLNLWTRVG